MAAAAKRPNFLRRTKTTSSPEGAESEIQSTTVETTTSKFSRRPGSKFKSRKEIQESAKEAGKTELKRPSLNSGAVRTERPARNFVRRRQVGANATTTRATITTGTLIKSSAASTVATTRRPFRIASRRRPLSTTSTARPTNPTVQPTTTTVYSEESLEDDTDLIEDPSLQERIVSQAKSKQQRRPLVLKDEDQKPSATNEEERKRQNKALNEERKSKKYSASINQNQLDEVIKKAKSSEEVDGTTAGTWTTVDDFSAETAVAIAAHQLLSAPLPIVTTYDDNGTQTTRLPTPKRTPIRDYTSTEYDDNTFYRTTPITTRTTPRTSVTKNSNEDSTSAFYKTTPITTTYSSNSRYTPRTSSVTKSTSRSPRPFTRKVSEPTGFTTANILSSLPIQEFGRSTISPAYSRVSQSPSLGPGFDVISQNLGSSPRHLGSNGKPIPVPVEDYSLSPGYSSLGEPSFFTREYLLESPVTKTYDDEYQYLSPVTPQTTTHKLPKKNIYKKISTTFPPTPYPESTTFSPSPSPKPRRIATRKPFEKIPAKVVNKIKHTYRPIENYDYYDDGVEKMGNKYEEGTKVVIHGKGTIECLDIGNFPHPSSCKKFISCARIHNGSILGWEYICPKGLSFDPVGSICNWSAGLGCDEKDA